jgi:arylsulfatase A
MSKQIFRFITVLLVGLSTQLSAADRPPNFVIVYADDLGYSDVGCFGAKGYETPHLDRMASEGTRCTSFYVAQAVCSASRTALLTGCYPNRLGILGALGPKSKHGINADEMLISEVLKQRGYATAIYGKWHLGHHEKFLPPQHGFDDYFGLPYSNDMWPFHPTDKSFPDLPMVHGNQVIDAQVTPEEQTQLTTLYTEQATKFIEQHRDQPFFVYVPQSMPHVPLFVSQKFKGKTKRGLFGDVLSEVDWSVGQILDTLKRLDLDNNTLVIFTSDNGPWLSYGSHAGSAGPLREGKGTVWEGGVRVPFVARWPGKIPAGAECKELAATIDLLPTLAKLAAAPLPPKPIDGLDIWPLLSGAPNAKTPHEAYYFYWGRALHAVRSGQWKLHFPHPYRSFTSPPTVEGQPGKYSDANCGLELYDLASDLGEKKNVREQHPDVVARLQAFADSMRKDLGDELQKLPGSGVREPGQL